MLACWSCFTCSAKPVAELNLAHAHPDQESLLNNKLSACKYVATRKFIKKIKLQ